MKLMPQSPSSVSTYNTCPKQYQAKYITKEVVFKSTAETERGTRWHKQLEDRLRDKLALPEETAVFEPLIRRLELMKGEKLAETRFGITADFKPCDYKQRWYGGTADVVVLNHEDRKAVIFDYKTGKVKDNEDFRKQLTNYALMAFIAYPHIQQIRVAYIFLDSMQFSPIEHGRKGLLFKQSDMEQMKSDLSLDIERIAYSTEKNEWLPNPGGLCRPNKPTVNGGKPWCQVKSCPFYNKR